MSLDPSERGRADYDRELAKELAGFDSVRRQAGVDEGAMYTGGPDTPELMAAHRARGGFFPSDLVVPLVKARFNEAGEWSEMPKVAGSATMLGGDLILTAAHVADLCVEEVEDVPMAAILELVPATRVVFTRVSWFEVHPDCDLALGKLIEWNARGYFDGFGRVASMNEVFSVGYPIELLAPLQAGDTWAINNPRYLRGYVTRGMETANDGFAQPRSMELSFPLSPGMSGSPIWGFDPESNARVLSGVAIGTTEMRAGWRQESYLDDQGVACTRQVERTIDYGVAVRLGAVLDWKVQSLGGIRLGELVPSEATGELPEHLRHGSSYWRPAGVRRSGALRDWFDHDGED